ncbi:MAG: YggS family pyridoxal phosphate-dependent enzyme [Synechococcales cyanobacterium T60_A2020_003]|nr:YggS family pyridoxal phosphate-dependent enzyme [Synechococcales cyanobacterium T60_A2020_003]
MNSSWPTTSIADRIHHIRQTIPVSVRLIAVSKQVSSAAIRAAYDAGVRDFAESRIQEAIAKQNDLSDLQDITWHFIGHLQTNKVAKAVQHFQWIHSVDSLKLAEYLDRYCDRADDAPYLCLQVKVLPDPNKYGWSVDELMADLPKLDALKHIRVRGLMTILPYGLEEATMRRGFQDTHALAERIRQQSWKRLQMQELSMGMSDDYSLAIAAGATMIRLGRTLFGDRTA